MTNDMTISPHGNTMPRLNTEAKKKKIMATAVFYFSLEGLYLKLQA